MQQVYLVNDQQSLEKLNNDLKARNAEVVMIRMVSVSSMSTRNFEALVVVNYR